VSPPLPVIVKVYVPSGALSKVSIVRVEVKLEISVSGLKKYLPTFLGRPDRNRETGSDSPPWIFTETEKVVDSMAVTFLEEGEADTKIFMGRFTLIMMLSSLFVWS
jgi:hypothetical protein